MAFPILIVIFAITARPGDVALPVPRFEKGQEIPFVGEIVDESTRPGQSYRNVYTLNVRWLVLEANDKRIDLAVLTSITPKSNPEILAASKLISGANAVSAKSTVRVDLVRMEENGSIRLLAIPSILPPFSLSAEHRLNPLPALPLSGPAFVEWGMIPPKKLGRDDGEREWIRSTDESWNGGRVLDLSSTRSSKDFDNLAAAVAGWRRVERLYLSPTDGLPRSYARRIVQREGKSIVTTVDVRLEMKAPIPAGDAISIRHNRREAESAAWFAAEWERISTEGNKLDPRAAQALKAKISQYLVDHQPPTSFRPAIEAVASQVRE